MAEKILWIVLLCFFATAHAQSDPIEKQALDSLPPELQGQLNDTEVEKLKNTSIDLFKEKCVKNGAPEAFELAEKAYKEFPACVKNGLGITDPTVLQKEIDAAKPNGTVDEVFKKYCTKTPEVKKCMMTVSEAAKPCFTAEELENIKTVYNVTEQIAEFICFKDGDRIALFIAEKGPECFEEKQEKIRDCVNGTLGKDYQFNPSNLSAAAIPEISFGEKECQQMTKLQDCVVDALAECNAPTSANIVESLFKFARNATPCKKFEKQKKGAATALGVTSATVLLGLVTAMLV